MALVVAISDLHLDHSTHGVSRFDEVARALSDSAQYAVSQKAACWIFGGDLCDPDSGPIVLRCVEVLISTVLYLASHHVPVVMISGNHDVIEIAEGPTTLSPLRPIANRMKGVHLLEDPDIVEVSPLPTIVAFPFVPTSRAYDPAEHARRCVDDWSMTISHLNVAGVQPGEETKELPRGREVLFPCGETSMAVARIQGHYHQAQDFDPKDGGPPLKIIGSPARLSMGEGNNDPSFLALRIG